MKFVQLKNEICGIKFNLKSQWYIRVSCKIYFFLLFLILGELNNMDDASILSNLRERLTKKMIYVS